jgi:TRAP transporter 4TM/12TM fusion protein
VPIRVAATYAFLFVMFGTFLGRAGGSEFFFNIAAILAGRRPGGPAKIAVVSSGLYGMLSGSPTSDVVTTGSVTIPMMKRMGYPAPLAGAFEVAASTGGSLLPPVMGSAAFIMAEYTGIDYRDIVTAAILPASLYYVSVYAQVHLRSLKLGLRGMSEDEIPQFSTTFRLGGVFIIPLFALIVALLMGYSPNMVAVFGAVSVIAVSLFRRATRLGPVKIFEAMAETTTRMVSITGACAAAGLVIGGITMTGLGMKFAELVTVITQGHLFFSLLVAAVLTIILGMGMPTPSAYILAAALVGPLLTKEFGIPVMAAHMMLLYFAVMSAITPPVAVAAYAAAPLADANPLHIAVLAVRLALGAFVVPLAFVYNQELLMVGAWSDILMTFAKTGIGLILLAIAVEGYIRAPLAWWVRILCGAAGVCFIIPGTTSLLAAIVLTAIALVCQFSFGKSRETPASS